MGYYDLNPERPSTDPGYIAEMALQKFTNVDPSAPLQSTFGDLNGEKTAGWVSPPATSKEVW